MLYGMLRKEFKCSREQAMRTFLSEAFALSAYCAETGMVPLDRSTDAYVAQERFKCQ